MKKLIELFQKISYSGLEYIGLYYSFYPGYVADKEDPENRNRLKLKVPNVFGDEIYPVWISQRSTYSGEGYGIQLIPEVGDMVWVRFRNGKVSNPFWDYGYWVKGEKPKELDDTNKIWLKTSKGHVIEIDNKKNYISITHEKGNRIEINEKGISIITKGSDKIYLGSLDKATSQAMLGNITKTQLEIDHARLEGVIKILTGTLVPALTSPLPPVTPWEIQMSAAINAAITAMNSLPFPDYSQILSDKVKLD